MKIKSAVWQGARTVRKKLCQLVLFVQENAWQTGVQGKKASVAWMREFIWQERHFICGRNHAFLEQKAPGQCSFPGADCVAVSARIMILPSGAGDGL